MAEKPPKHDRVARFGGAVLSKPASFSTVFGPDREGRGLSYSKDSSSEGMLTGKDRNNDKNRGRGGLSGDRREI